MINFFFESNEKIRKDNMLDITVRTKNLILELIPPKQVFIHLLICMYYVLYVFFCIYS